jgi:hypothetical protein
MSFHIGYVFKISVAAIIVFFVTSLVLQLNRNSYSIPQWYDYGRTVISSAIAGGIAYMGACLVLNVSEGKAILSSSLYQMKRIRLRLFG